MSTWYSSYEENNYGDLFYSLIRIYQPEKVVELGTKTGYSAYHMARGLEDNDKGTLDCYDLWENYLENEGIDFMHKSVAKHNLEEFKHIVSLTKRDAVGVDKLYDMVDILHIDLDNGEPGILDMVIPAWIDKTRQIIIIEGGSAERDKIDLDLSYKKMPVGQWINKFGAKEADYLKKLVPKQDSKTGRERKYVIVNGDKRFKKIPIQEWLKEFSKKRPDIEYFTFEPFPSLTIIRKR